MAGACARRQFSQRPAQDCSLHSTRIVLVGLPRLLRDLIRAELDAHERLYVAAEGAAAEDAATLAQAAAPDVLVLGVPGALDTASLCRLLALHTNLDVIAVVDDGRTVKQLKLSLRDVEPTPAGIVQAILSRRDPED